jgi:hypothetical protein
VLGGPGRLDLENLARNDADLPIAEGSRDVRTSLVNVLKRLINGLDVSVEVKCEDNPLGFPSVNSGLLLVWSSLWFLEKRATELAGWEGIWVGGRGKFRVRSARPTWRGC